MQVNINFGNTGFSAEEIVSAAIADIKKENPIFNFASLVGGAIESGLRKGVHEVDINIYACGYGSTQTHIDICGWAKQTPIYVEL